MDVQFIKTDAGELAVLPRADYEALRAALDVAREVVEDAEDLAHSERVMVEVRAGRTETLTDAEVGELLDALSPLAFWRKRRGLTQAALAAKVGVSQAHIATIEGGTRGAGLPVMLRLAEALGVKVESLATRGPSSHRRSGFSARN